MADSREPRLQPRRPWGWMLVALAIFFVMAIGLAIVFLRFVDRGNALGDVYGLQAAVAHAVEDYARAAELLERAIEAGIPEERLPNHYFLLGNDYYLLGEVDKAIQAQQHALELDPEFYPAWMSLGTAFWSVGSLTRAEECYGQVVALAPTEPRAHASLGRLFLEQGQVEQAVKSLEWALALDPHSAAAHAYLALAYAQQGRFQNAQDSLRSAKENGYADWRLLQDEIERLEGEWQEP